MGKRRELEELELELDILEIEAYRELQGEGFDFGDGYIVSECRGSDDEYYSSLKQNKINRLQDMEEKEYAKGRQKKKRNNRYARKRKAKWKELQRFKRVQGFWGPNRDIYQMVYPWYSVTRTTPEKAYMKRWYISNLYAYAKRQTNRAIRRNSEAPKKGGQYKKYFDLLHYIW